MKSKSHYLFTDLTGNKISINTYEMGKGEPTLYIQGGIHGGEVTFFIFHEIVNYLLTIENELKFKILLVPMVNPMAWNQQFYHYTTGKFNIIDGIDFNKNFSDFNYEKNIRYNMSLETKMANRIIEMATPYKILLDFHTARQSKPYLYVEHNSYKNFAEFLNFKMNIVDPLQVPSHGTASDFSTYFTQKYHKNKYVFTVECGSHDEFNIENINEVKTRIILLINELKNNKFEFLKTNHKNNSTFIKPKKWIYAHESCFVKFEKKSGDSVIAGEELATIYDINHFGKSEKIYSDGAYIVIENTKSTIYRAGSKMIWLGMKILDW